MKGDIMNREAELLLYCSKLNITELDKQKICEITNDGFINWGTFLYYCIHHRVTPLVMRTIKKLGLIKLIESNVLFAMESICYNIKRYNEAFYEEVGSVSKDFYTNGIKAIMLKGGLFAHLIYRDISLRQFADIDYLVNTDDIPRILSIMEENGFIQGLYDTETREMILATNREKINRRLTSNEIFPHVKINKASGIPVYIDINFGIFWNGSLKNKNRILFDAADIIKEGKIVEINNFKVYSLPTEYQILQLCAHHYGEAINFCWSDVDWLINGNEICLYKFCDLYELIAGQDISWEKLYKIATTKEIEEPIYYSLKIVNMLFGEIVPEEFLISLNVSEKVIDKYSDKNGDIRYWDTNFYDRMFRIEDKVSEIVAKEVL